MAIEFDSDLAALEREILESVRGSPERRAIQQRIRSSFAVAEAISDLFVRTKRDRGQVAKACGLDLADIEDVLVAAPGVSTSLELILALASELGYRFEIQLFPAARLTEAKSRDVELVGDGILGGVLIRFAAGLHASDIRAEVLGGVRRLVAKVEGTTAESPGFLRREGTVQHLLASTDGWGSGQLTLADLIAIADQLEYKVQLRFSEHAVRTEAKPARREITASSSGGIVAAFRSYKTVSS